MDFLTTKQVATLLGVNRETIRRWILDGQLPGVRHTDTSWFRIERTELEKYAQERGIKLNWALLEEE